MLEVVVGLTKASAASSSGKFCSISWFLFFLTMKITTITVIIITKGIQIPSTIARVLLFGLSSGPGPGWGEGSLELYFISLKT